jgi:phosphoribosylaminoimidazolecarboxamide formyltransferase/IMP cyclohydrolase
MSWPKVSEKRASDIRQISGGFLIQEADDKLILPADWRLVTSCRLDNQTDLESLFFAWKVVKNVKSNAIVIAKGTKTVGIGAGQMSRVDSVIIAVRKSKGRAQAGVLASDAFFPKEDAIQYAAEAGIKAIVQPGGSIADEKIIRVADKFNIAMYFSGRRHFRH